MDHHLKTMEKLKLLLVGGFLGSGKTTAILQAARYLASANKKVATITNDQGAIQVDTAWMKGQSVPTEEVSAGCFCCQFDELEDRIELLLQAAKPDILFAEAVGSCVDLAATVINPLLSLSPQRYDVALSVFADGRLLLRSLQQEQHVFCDPVQYIYENQLREADILVVNKVDLLSEAQVEWLRQRIASEYGDKVVLYQNSLSEYSVGRWLRACNEFSDGSLRQALDIDYDIYGAGEAKLAWLDEEIGIVSPDGNAIRIAYELMATLHKKISENGHPIGHLKFLLDEGRQQVKVSFTAISDPGPAEQEEMQADRAVIIVNARIQVAPEFLQLLVRRTILDLEARTGCRITEFNLSAFQPGYPRPTHRITRAM